MLLKDKKAIVTGGSKGIGKHIVKSFLENGCSVWYLSRSEGDTLKEYSSLAEEKGVSLHFVKADVGTEAEVTETVKSILAESGGIDILVNNAGITKDGLLFRMSLDDWDTVLKVNLTSAFLVSKLVARQMAKQRSGSIINMSSIVGVNGNGGQCNYAASKAGLIGFSKSMAKEIASRGVRVNVIAPGFIQTEMTEKLTDEVKQELQTRIPLSRLGSGEDIANTAVFLGSDMASYITGQVLLVDGGMGM
ncbi:MAG: 3-oxoacyl-[acyl-carrier-protein] reductase [Spirochaetia bacterium]